MRNGDKGGAYNTCCEYGNEHVGSLKFGEFLTS